MAGEPAVLVVDHSGDEETARELADRIDCEATTAAGPDRALELLDDRAFDCVVADVADPGFFASVEADHPEVRTVLFTAGGTGVAADALAAGADDYSPRDGDDEYAVLAAAVEREIDRRRRTSERERDLEMYKTVVEAAGDAMYAIDEEGYITMINDSHAELAGYPRSEMIGSHALEYMREEDFRKGTEIIAEILSNPGKGRGRFELRGDGLYPGDEERFFEDILAVVTDENGDYQGSIGVIRDVTERKQRERELERQNERLDEFASVVAHDLRTPLSVASGLVEAASDRYDDDDLGEALRTLRRMERLIDDLLTLARQGQTVDDLERIDLVDVVQRAWPDPPEAELVLEDPPRTLEADHDRLVELFENLFRNAVEHAGPGVTVTVGGLPDEGFLVADDGPGIDPHHRQDVLEHGFTTDEDGTGFGLAIVNRIAGAHDWSVTVTESDDGGARFEVRAAETTVERATGSAN